MGRLSDYIGPIKVSLLCALIQIASLLGFGYVESLSGIYTLSVIHGIPYIPIVQGYALILRYLYGPTIGGWRLCVIMLFAMAGMAVGGWLFFFSSRRRHTSYIGDWSSDVCSSD